MKDTKIIQWFVFFVAAFAACASVKESVGADQTVPGATKWGYYDGEPVTKWNPDGRTMTLLTELRYRAPNGNASIAPIGSVVDGASIPRYLWSCMDGQVEGR